jgi:NADPH-dependent curcumin reductase CurA
MLTTLSLRLYAPERSWTIELLTVAESAPAALVGLFRGGNIGKAVVRLYQ